MRNSYGEGTINKNMTRHWQIRNKKKTKLNQEIFTKNCEFDFFKGNC